MECPHCNYIIPKYEYQSEHEGYSNEERQMYEDYEKYGEFFTTSNIVLKRECSERFRDESKITEIIGCPKCKMVFI
jgi:hypothetical protein